MISAFLLDMFCMQTITAMRLPATGSRLPYQGKITCTKQANYLRLFNNAGNNAGSNGSAAFTDSEAEDLHPLRWDDEFDFHANVSPGITISTPSGSLITPVTSVVLK